MLSHVLALAYTLLHLSTLSHHTCLHLFLTLFHTLWYFSYSTTLLKLFHTCSTLLTLDFTIFHRFSYCMTFFTCLLTCSNLRTPFDTCSNQSLTLFTFFNTCSHLPTLTHHTCTPHLFVLLLTTLAYTCLWHFTHVFTPFYTCSNLLTLVLDIFHTCSHSLTLFHTLWNLHNSLTLAQTSSHPLTLACTCSPYLHGTLLRPTAHHTCLHLFLTHYTCFQTLLGLSNR